MPPDHRQAGAYTIDVIYRGDDLWAVVHQDYCLGGDGTWRPEPLRWECSDGLGSYWFPLDEALQRARAAALRVTVRGRTAADVLAAVERQCAAELGGAA